MDSTPARGKDTRPAAPGAIISRSPKRGLAIAQRAIRDTVGFVACRLVLDGGGSGMVGPVMHD